MRNVAQRSLAAVGLAAVADELDAHPRDLDKNEAEHNAVVESFAPARALALPDYVSHAPNATRVGMLSAQAVVMEFENTAKEIEKLGDELRAAQARSDESQATLAKALGDLTATAKAFREEAARVFKHVEEVTAKSSEASALCQTLREKIASV